LGNDITAAFNFGMHYFQDTNTNSNNFFRVSKVSNAVTIYYQNVSASTWTALTGGGTSLLQLGDSTSQFDIANPSGTTFRYTWDTTGTDPDIDGHLYVGDELIINAQNFNAANNGTFTITAVSTNYFEITNASGVIESNKTIGTGSIIIKTAKCSFVNAEECAFMVNGRDPNRYISSDGTTVVTSATASGHLYNSPVANKINYYKGSLYVGDYKIGTTRYKTGIMKSSKPVGIVALVDGDHTPPITSLKVTDTKYIQASDSLNIYRGGSSIGTVTVTAKTEDTLTISSFGSNINSADEVWVASTYSGTKVFRWPDNPSSGSITVKQYDTFQLSGGNNDALTMLANIGDVMMIASKSNMGVWNDYNLTTFDLGIGCVSDRGYVKCAGVLFFIDYTGIYATTGSKPQYMSQKVEKYISGATKAGLEGAAAGKKKNSIFFYIGDVTLYNDDGSTLKTLTDVVLEYDLQKENWYVHTEINANEFKALIGTTDPDRIIFSSPDDGNLYEFLTGTADDAVTSDKEIAFEATTAPIVMAGQIEDLCYPKRVIIEMSRGNSLKAFVSVDNNDFYEIGDARKGVSILTIEGRDKFSDSPPSGRKVKISLRESSTRALKITGVALDYALTLEEEEIHHQ
jgi:hypothetical protein